MLGSVHAWSELMLIPGIGVVVILGVVSGRATVLLKNVMSLPSVALGGLVLLGLAQSTPQPERMLAVLDPSTSALRRALLPDVPERVGNESAATIPLTALHHQSGAGRDARDNLEPARCVDALSGRDGSWRGVRCPAPVRLVRRRERDAARTFRVDPVR